MIIEGQVGPQAVTDGARVPPRLGKGGESLVSELRGRYYEQSSRGNTYTAMMAAAAALGTALAAANATITLYNPAGSGVNLSLLNVNGILATVGAGATQVVLAGHFAANQAAPSSLTEIAVRNTLLVPARGKGIVYSAATFGAAPLILRGLMQVVATGSTFGGPACDIDVAGGIVLSPNTGVVVQGLTTAATGMFGMTWEEIPL